MNGYEVSSINLVLHLLRKTLIECGVSVAVNKKTGDLHFFKTLDFYRNGESVEGIPTFTATIGKLVE